MKIRVDFFTVPVDFVVMADCRKQAGYQSARHLAQEIKRRGYSFLYHEYPANNSSSFRNDKAEVIAAAMGMGVTVVFPRYAESKAAYIRAATSIKMKEMDIYFTVPVDAHRLRTCRESSGYPSATEFTKVLSKISGQQLKYREYENPNSDRRHIKGNKAELIAAAMGMAVTAVFPQYAESKATKEKFVAEHYYQPFNTVEERNLAIMENMEIAKCAALKFGYIYVDRLPYCFRLDHDEMISVGYETLVSMADEAMKKGIKKDVEFKWALIVAIKYAFSQICIASRAKMGENFAVSSLLDNDEWDDALQSQLNLEDQFIQREEVRKAVWALTIEQRQDKRIQELLREYLLEVRYA